MNVVTFNSEKGGTGKTTLAANIAALAAARDGQRVLLIDADPQGHATVSFRLPKEPGLYDVLVRHIDLPERVRIPKPDVYAYNGQVKGRLYVLPSNEETHSIPTHVNDWDALAEQLADFSQHIDLVVIDTSPSPGMLLAIIYAATDYVVIPTKAEFLALDGLVATTTRIQKSKHKQMKLLGIVPNEFQKQTQLHTHNLRELMKAAEQFKWPVWSPLAMRTVWREASNWQRMVYTHAPDSAATADLIRLSSRIQEGLCAQIG